MSSPSSSAPLAPPRPPSAPTTPGARRASGSLSSRIHSFGTPDSRRILGYDVARFFAIFGMIVAHTVVISDFDIRHPDTWIGIVNGNSSVLFAVLAGVSIALMTGRSAIPSAPDLPRIRLQFLGRGATIFLLGLAMEMLHTPVAVILTLWGLLYVAIFPFVGLRRRYLVMWAVLIALLGPILARLFAVVFLDPSGPGLTLVLYGVYSTPVWISLMLVGMILGRSDLHLPGKRAILAGITAAAFVIFASASLVLSFIQGFAEDSSIVDGIDSASNSASSGQVSAFEGPSFESIDAADLPEGAICVDYGDRTYYCGDTYDKVFPEFDDSSISDGSSSGWTEYWGILVRELTEPYDLIAALLSPMPHSGSTAEIVISGSFALFVIGVCVLACIAATSLFGGVLRWLVLPFAIIGAMPLTAYCLHVFLLFIAIGPTGSSQSPGLFAFVAGGVAVVSILWWLMAGRGPLERLAGWVAARAARGLS